MQPVATKTVVGAPEITRFGG